MEDKYYLVQKGMHHSLRKTDSFHGTAFVEVSEGVLEHIAGDRFITQALEFSEGELRPKTSVYQNYEIFPVRKIDFDFYVAGYSENLRQEEMKARIHSKRIWPHA